MNTTYNLQKMAIFELSSPAQKPQNGFSAIHININVAEIAEKSLRVK